MVINIPIQVDEQKMQEVIKQDYQNRVMTEIVKYIKSALASQSQSYRGNSEREGMTNLIKSQIDNYLAGHSDEIIEIAGKILAERLARSKKGKELLESFEEVKE